MRLKSSIFLWVSVATILPMTALILGITAYSEQLYRKNIDNDVFLIMENIAKELEFRLRYERQVMLSLANSPAMRQFSPILRTAAKGDLHIRYFEEVNKLNNFLAGFQHSVPGIDTVRVLDIKGHTLIKVRFGKQIPTDFEGIADLPLAEEELVDFSFLHWMSQLQPNKLVYGSLPLSKRDHISGREISLMNSIVPVSFDNKNIIGYLTGRALGDQFDHILESLPRTNNIKLTIAESNPDTPLRDGMLLYSDELQIKFSQPLNPDIKLSKHLSNAVWEKIQSQRYGTYIHNADNRRFYFREFYPYNNQLVSWILVLHLDNNTISAPFQRIRLGLFAFAGLALGISLLLANMGARLIAEPITHFARILKRYADGEHKFAQYTPKGAEELRQLDQSFHYLVNTLETTEKERDRAQKMMLQNAKLASIGEMAAGIGHEINNPLNNILSYARLIERELPDNNKEMHEDIQGLQNEAQRAGKIIQGILNFARQVPPEYTEFDLHVWINDTLQLVQTLAQKNDVKLQINRHTDLLIYGDRNQLQQVLVNLLMNAIQASTAGDVIMIHTQIVEQNISIIVSDQGTGIDETNLHMIYDPFFTTKSVGEGSGLGLSISLGILQYHNGSLKLVNNLRGGVDAIMLLPVTTAHD
ncbi:signal transduction histidine kinase, nitrogen specific, NtrB [hydrothermal vent metagenome]|uniref:Signal transduction histidine kinase, nitrogen specific, NtrB n=1 Tax=hydrothermal vent metagenome TaxID=652676 RepID=A0A3B0XW30_9ZZZZ